MKNESEQPTPFQRAQRATVRFCFSYEFDGASWHGDVWATTWEEAEMKIQAMGRGKIDGVVGEIIPAD